MAPSSHLLSLPNELIGEIISHLTISYSASPSSSSTLEQSHWAAFAHYRLMPSSCRDLQNLALVHTHLVEPCRSQLFRALRVYPAMPPARVTALIDLFLLAPELVQQVKALWWTVGVEEYKATASYQWFKYASEEREVRKAKDRLELVEALTKRDRQSECGLRKVWVTGCESQRKFDNSQRTITPNGFPSSFSLFAVGGLGDEGFMMKALGGLLSGPTVGYVSLANIAFPGEVFRRCVGLEVLRLGDDVTVLEPCTSGKAGHTKRGVQNAPRLRVLSLASGLAPDIGANATAQSLFEQESAVFEDSQEDRNDPLIDLNLLQSVSCQYPSSAFSSVIRNLGQDNIRNVALHVNDFDGLTDDALDVALHSLCRETPLESLFLHWNLPSITSYHVGQSHITSDLPGLVGGLSLPNSLLVPPGPISERVMDLITVLLPSEPSKVLARAVDLTITTSVEQGLRTLSGPEALDLLPLARKMLSRLSGESSVTQRQSIKIHFLLRLGCSSGSGGRLAPGVEGDTGSNLGLQSLEAKLVECHAEAIGLLSGVGVNMEIGYDRVA